MKAKKKSAVVRRVGAAATGVVGAAALMLLGAGCKSNAPVASADTVGGNYKDGTYSADGTYMTHAGPETVHIGVTLKNGVITDTTFQATPRARMSARYQGMFAANYKPLVVGKNIGSVHLSKVSGSSLTPMGFNQALDKIKAEAAAKG